MALKPVRIERLELPTSRLGGWLQPPLPPEDAYPFSIRLSSPQVSSLPPQSKINRNRVYVENHRPCEVGALEAPCRPVTSAARLFRAANEKSSIPRLLQLYEIARPFPPSNNY